MFNYTEDDLLPISALQHFYFCERQWALIHLESLWEDSRLTLEGAILHENVDTPQTKCSDFFKVARSARIRSLKYGIVGIADVIEFHFDKRQSRFIPYPIEYKRGKPKVTHEDCVQLCAQTLCIEEMLNVKIPYGAFYYNEIRRRHQIEMTEALRTETINTILKLHKASYEQKTPPAIYTNKCENCSLIHKCLPKITNKSKDPITFINSIYDLADE